MFGFVLGRGTTHVSVVSARGRNSPFLDNGVADNGVQTIGAARGCNVNDLGGFYKRESSHRAKKTSVLLSPKISDSKCGEVLLLYLYKLPHKGTFEYFCLDPGFAKEENAFTRYLCFIIIRLPGCIVSNAADSQWENNLAPSPTAQTAQTCTLAQK